MSHLNRTINATLTILALAFVGGIAYSALAMVFGWPMLSNRQTVGLAVLMFMALVILGALESATDNKRPNV